MNDTEDLCENNQKLIDSITNSIKHTQIINEEDEIAISPKP